MAQNLIYKNPVLKLIVNGFLVCASKYEKKLVTSEYDSTERYIGEEEVYFKEDEEAEAIAKLKEYGQQTMSSKSAGIPKTTKQSKDY